MEVGGGTSPSTISNDFSIRQQKKIDGVEVIIGELPTIFPVQFSFFFLFLVCRFQQFYIEFHAFHV